MGVLSPDDQRRLQVLVLELDELGSPVRCRDDRHDAALRDRHAARTLADLAPLLVPQSPDFNVNGLASL